MENEIDLLPAQLESLISQDKYEITVLSNTSALIFQSLPEVSWAGFYLLRDGKLILGPFQGKVACTEIKIGRGVCGTSAEKKETVIVKDVHKFPGHIACDSESNSEIVLPIFKNGEIYGVLDLDSKKLERFDEKDKTLLESLVKVLEKKLIEF
ncbi:GAF domain-containing protein [Neocallimastix lanati (nom. inval.)]|uniref:GAF domain-containing protein n=1 Tax=Neocallimastix californiae TaxID=1754190 RepID=A0A1Y2FHH3_9FUNG|nr:GAF domain-containing protein [Neocallimastix sp. JGI-2020a]ORY83411.1 GAF domain-containing protein [Neocallimastix californiae]|eukprot:ORY83411.1 GAF domain-containing protein [Neocallimastix californiae]